MKTAKTIEVKIFCGLRAQYTSKVYSAEIVRKELQEYCDRVSLCVSVTETNFVYKNGKEPGVLIGLINYPRFPSSDKKILEHAKEIGYALMYTLEQNRVTIITPTETIMLEKEDDYRRPDCLVHPV